MQGGGFRRQLPRVAPEALRGSGVSDREVWSRACGPSGRAEKVPPGRRVPGSLAPHTPSSSSTFFWEKLHEKCPGNRETGPEGHLPSVPWEGEGSWETEEHLVGQCRPPLAHTHHPPRRLDFWTRVVVSSCFCPVGTLRK